LKFRETYKVTVFVPPNALEQVLAALRTVTHLQYGAYDHVAWHSAPGVEEFRPLPNAKPTVGNVGELCRHPSAQLIFCISREARLFRAVVDAILSAHPWEQPIILAEEALAPEIDG
jgi:hypothetical protein